MILSKATNKTLHKNPCCIWTICFSVILHVCYPFQLYSICVLTLVVIASSNWNTVAGYCSIHFVHCLVHLWVSHYLCFGVANRTFLTNGTPRENKMEITLACTEMCTSISRNPLCTSRHISRSTTYYISFTWCKCGMLPWILEICFAIRLDSSPANVLLKKTSIVWVPSSKQWVSLPLIMTATRVLELTRSHLARAEVMVQ